MFKKLSLSFFWTVIFLSLIIFACTLDIQEQSGEKENSNSSAMEKRGDVYVLDGDMILLPDDYNHYQIIKEYYPDAEYTGPEVQSSKALFGQTSTVWPNRKVYYRMIGLTAAREALVLSAMQTIQLVSKVRFVSRDQTSYTIQIRPSTAVTIAESTIGYSSGPYININFNNAGRGNIIHELLHSIGFLHEHQRADRTDDPDGDGQGYVTVTGTGINYDVDNGQTYGAYDYDSIMHYPDIAGKISLNGNGHLYQRRHLSSSDVQGLLAKYGGHNWYNMFLFDVNAYYSRYADLRAAFGLNVSALKNHWINNGRYEGRQASIFFNARYYLNKYPDLKNAYGTNYIKAAQHYMIYGIRNSRQGSRIFNAQFYLNKYPDLATAYDQDNNIMAAYHFYLHGLREGRQASADFSIKAYVNRYPDLKAAYGTNYKAAMLHWLRFGIYEGRNPRP